MSPVEMARIYALAFPHGRAWSAGEIEAQLATPGAFFVHVPHGFALGRVTADEAELITIAVDPPFQGNGIGRTLLAAFEAETTRRGAETGFLEVAADNVAGLALYRAEGWRESGRRKRYYSRANGPVDAITMAKVFSPS